MRLRAARIWLGIALAAAMAVTGMAAAHVGAGFLSRPIIGMAAVPAHAAASGLPGLHGHHAHERVTAVDVLPAPATLLAMLMLLAVVVRRFRPPVRLASSTAHARGPPAQR